MAPPRRRAGVQLAIEEVLENYLRLMTPKSMAKSARSSTSTYMT